MLCLIDSIRDDDPSVQYLLRVLEDASSLTALILAAWQVARVLAVQLVETVLDERARQPTVWPPCLACGAAVRSKGFVTRQITSVVGTIRWQRWVGRCPQGCALPQVPRWMRPSRSLCRVRPRLGCWGGIVVMW